MSSATAKAKRREERLSRMRAARARRRTREYEVDEPRDYDLREPLPIPIPERMRELRGYPGRCDCGPPMSARMPVIDSQTLRSLRGADSKKKRKSKKRRSRGKGKWCVYSKGGKLVRCYEKKTTAHKVRKGFGRSFKVKRRK